MKITALLIEPNESRVLHLDGTQTVLLAENTTVVSLKGNLWSLKDVLHVIDEGEEG